MSKSKPGKTGPRLADVEDYIRGLNLTTDAEATAGAEIWFSNVDFGGLRLFGEEVEEYKKILNAVVTRVAHPDLVSKRTIERWLQKAILAAVRPKDPSAEEFEARLKAAIDTLGTDIRRTAVEYEVFYPVLGLREEELPFRIGNTTFQRFDEQAFEGFEKIARHPEFTERVQQQLSDALKRTWENGASDAVFCSVKADAIDSATAIALAVAELRTTLDVINFFADLIPYNHGHAILPGDGGTADVITLVVRNEGSPSLAIDHKALEPHGLLSLMALQKLDEGEVFAKLDSLLSEPRTELQNYLLAALRWAGRATGKKEKEEAFLLYAIALESLLLSDQDATELTYRLRIRLAHLVGETSEERAQVAKDMARLYRIRSRIVHSGETQITDADLSQIRALAKGAIYHILMYEPFVNMRTAKDLASWFDGRILNTDNPTTPA